MKATTLSREIATILPIMRTMSLLNKGVKETAVL